MFGYDYKINRYPKIFHLGDRHLKQLFDDDVFVEIKLDGSQLCFSVHDHLLHIRSKGKVIYPEAPDKMFKNGVSHIVNMYRDGNIVNGIEYYCEYMKNKTHNTLSYKTIPKNHLMLFAAKIIKEDRMISDRLALKKLADAVQIDVVHTLYQGKISKEEELEKYMGKESFYGGCVEEGIVIKNYTKELMIGAEILPVLTAKLVRKEFQEKNGIRWSKEEARPGKLEGIKAKYKSIARWEKAVQVLKEIDKYTGSPKDIGLLISTVQADLTVEEKDSIKDDLWQIDGKAIVSASTHGLAEWYKDKLLKEQSDNES